MPAGSLALAWLDLLFSAVLSGLGKCHRTVGAELPAWAWSGGAEPLVRNKRLWWVNGELFPPPEVSTALGKGLDVCSYRELGLFGDSAPLKQGMS